MDQFRRHKRRPKHRDEDSGEGELWLVSYADMVTLLFGFFVILYSFSTLDDSKFDQLSKELAQAFHKTKDDKNDSEKAALSDQDRQTRAFQLLISMMNLGNDTEEAIRQIESAASANSADETVKNIASTRLKVNDSNMIKTIQIATNQQKTVEIILPNETLFAKGSTEITPASAAKLKSFASDLRLMRGLVGIEVVGHTDSTPPASQNPSKDNFTVSSLRAGAVARALIQYGVDPRTLKIRGMGSLQPLAPEIDPQGRPLPQNMAKNRRVHIVLLRGTEGVSH